MRTWFPEQQRAEGPDLLSAWRDSQGLWEAMEQRTRASPSAGTPRRRLPRELHFRLAPRFPEARGLGAAFSASPHPGSWIRGLAALWELRVFHTPVLWGVVLSWVY